MLKKTGKLFGILLAVAMILIIGVISYADEADTAESALPDNGIPVVIIEIDEKEGHTIEDMNASKDHSVECYGRMQIIVPESFTCCDIDITAENFGPAKLDYIRGRGNSTWSYAKKPYKIKLDKKANLFGLGENKHWVLLANTLDESAVKNRLTFWLGDGLGFDFTPRGVPVDLVMVAKSNGEEVSRTYLGSYVLAEQVRIDKNRLNIPELSPKNVDPQDITGGYLIQYGQQEDDDSPNKFLTDRGEILADDTPTFDPADEDYTNEEQKDYIRMHIQDMEDAIFGVDIDEKEGDIFTNTKGLRYNEYMDMETAAKYWLIQEVSYNGDSYRTGSTYFYKKADTFDDDGNLSEMGKIVWGPLWDFDIAWGSNSPDINVKGFDLVSGWIVAMLYDDDPDGFRETAKRVWPEIRDKLLSAVEDGALLDQYYEELNQSYAADYEIWKDIAGFSYLERDDYSRNISNLKQWIQNRVAWLDAHIRGSAEDEYPNLDDAVCKICFVVDGQTARREYCQKNRAIRLYDPGVSEEGYLPEKEGYVFAGWLNEDGSDAGRDAYITEDRTFTAKFVTYEEATHAEEIVFALDEDWCNIDQTKSFFNHYTLLPTEAMEKKVTWRSSDESIATVDQSGQVSLKGTGTVTITARLSNGAESSYELTIISGEQPVLQDLVIVPEEITLTVGKHFHIDMQIFPKLAEKTGVWFASDSWCADVDLSGIVTAVEPGDAVIGVQVVFYGGAWEDDISIWKYCTVHVIEEEISYSFSKGEGSIWTKGSSSNLDLTVNRSVDDASAFVLFKEIEVDGAKLNEEAFTASSGSLNASLKPDFLETLSEGTHTLVVKFQDGETPKMTFTVEAESADAEGTADGSVNTGDDQLPALWAILMGASLLTLVLTISVIRKKTHMKR